LKHSLKGKQSSLIRSQSAQLAGDAPHHEAGRSKCLSHTMTKLSGSGYGSGRRNTPLAKLKIAVFAPMPKPSFNATKAVNPGARAALAAAHSEAQSGG
jgi:hypothetical protein